MAVYAPNVVRWIVLLCRLSRLPLPPVANGEPNAAYQLATRQLRTVTTVVLAACVAWLSRAP